ncbi:MAG: ATP-binding protein [Bacteroidales bacterium]|nr:ATP-binding protein [Bacteroidales bacterium]
MANTQNIDNPVIGIDLLKMLMLQLYSNPRCIFREYIQNALDSINEAVKIGILPRVKDGRVSISITKNDIYIEDNGTGIRRDKAVKILTDIANSVKNGIDTAGQFGVGRLSGGGYCEVLEFETTYQGEDISTIVSLDTRILRQLIDKKQTDISAEEAMTKICTTQEKSALKEDHRFIVRLKNVINSREILLDIDEIKNYITEYAPIDYSVPFNSLINSCEQTDFVKRHKSIDKIRVSLNDLSDIEKGYGLKIAGTGDQIEKIRYFELPQHPKYGPLGWGWYAVTEFSVQINEEKDSCAGIRLRKHNISLDKNILNTCFKESRGNKYFYGEIFITNDNIVPDSGRQGLAAGEEADALIKEIKRYFAETLRPVYYKANKMKTALNKAGEVIGKLNNPEFANAVGPLTDKLKEHIEEFKKATTPDSKEEINDVISIYTNKYNSGLKADVEKYLVPKQSPKETEPDILDMVAKPTVNNPTEPVAAGKPQNPHTPETEPQTTLPTSNPAPQPKTKSSDTQKPVSTPSPTQSNPNRPKSQVDEILSPLEGKNISPEQTAILKRVFSTMLVVCPSSNKKNVILLMEAAVNSL